MLVAVLHSPVSGDAGPDEQDTLRQVEAVSEALARLGHRALALPCTLDLSAVASRLREIGPDLVFNLVETIAGGGRLLPVAALLLDHIGLPYTGSPADALYLTSNKLLAKRVLRLHGVPVPDWVTAEELARGTPPPSGLLILKSAWEHASVGLDDDSLVEPEGASQLAEELARRREHLGRDAFAEVFLPGREFNLSLLERREGPSVLPVAEILFLDYPADKPTTAHCLRVHRASYHQKPSSRIHPD